MKDLKHHALEISGTIAKLQGNTFLVTPRDMSQHGVDAATADQADIIVEVTKGAVNLAKVKHMPSRGKKWFNSNYKVLKQHMEQI